MVGLGLLLLFAGGIAFLVGLVLLCIDSTRKSGLIILLSSLAMIIIGFSVCSYHPFRLYH